MWLLLVINNENYLKEKIILLDVSSHLHGLSFFNVTQNQQRQNFFQNLLKSNKTEKSYFINKIICLFKLIKFLFTHLLGSAIRCLKDGCLIVNLKEFSDNKITIDKIEIKRRDV